jgi:hypothetical protein
VKNMEEVFVLQPVTEQKPLSVFSKFVFIFPESFPEVDWLKLAKMAVLSFLGERFCRGKVVSRTPPEVVSGIGRGGGGGGGGPKITRG